MRRLIINADDFGLTPGVNQSIIECHGAGTVTSATLMASSSAYDDAVAKAKLHPSLRVGCHVTLVDSTPLLPTLQVSTLLAPRQQDFRQGIAGFAATALCNKLSPDQITAEATAQFRKIQNSGIELTHFDTHKHTHMFPKVIKALLQAAKDCGIRAVRNPFVPLKALIFANFVRRPRLWVRYSQVRALRRFEESFHREVISAGLQTTQGTFGIIATGFLDHRLFNAIIGSIPPGDWELVCHPGYNDADLGKVSTRLRASRAEELKVLTSPEAADTLKKHDIRLISYSDI
ncbi:MAG TPA: ChbG/HpnK family deacetylase [Terriglobales bacterium]|nr:ChbG/HpnK family deacetylase [Terriglobales bacterium]